MSKVVLAALFLYLLLLEAVAIEVEDFNAKEKTALQVQKNIAITCYGGAVQEIALL